MKKIKIISDSACDLSFNDREELGVEVISFQVSIDGENYKRELDQTTDSFYNTLIENTKLRPKTACPLMGDYLEAFEKYGNEYDIICVCLTSKFSASYTTALMAKEMCEENIKDVKISVIDSEQISLSQGLLIKEIKKMIDSGMQYEEVVSKTEELKKTGRVLFTIGTMEYLNRGGRIGKLALLLASKVMVRPIIVFKDGDIGSDGFSLGRKKSLIKLIDRIKSYFKKEEHNIEDYELAVGYGSDIEEGHRFLDTVKETLKSISEKITYAFDQIGTTIAVHTGPYPIGLAFIKKFDRI